MLKRIDGANFDVRAARGDFAAGEHAVPCDLALSPGVYVYRLEAGGLTAAKRLAVVR